MSETFKISSRIEQDKEKKQIHTDISHPKSIESGYIGRESNPVIAEAMAYTAKPLIEEVLSTLANRQDTADEFVGWEKGDESNDDRLVAKPVTRPVVIDETGTAVPYTELRNKVKKAYEAAGTLQENIYDDEMEARQHEATAASVRNRHL